MVAEPVTSPTAAPAAPATPARPGGSRIPWRALLRSRRNAVSSSNVPQLMTLAFSTHARRATPMPHVISSAAQASLARASVYSALAFVQPARFRSR